MSADDKAAAAWDDYVSQQQEEKIEELKRQLAAAQQRIQRLEQAGDAMANVLVWSAGNQYKRSPTASAWRKAKEAKQ